MTDLAAILDGYFNGGGVPTNLYIGFVSSVNFTGFDPDGDSMTSHAGWEEFTDYDEASRPEWLPGTTIDGSPASVNNPSPGEITPNDVGTIIGLFLCDDDTPGGTTGQLYGPWFNREGPQATIVGTPYRGEIKLTLTSNTTTQTA